MLLVRAVVGPSQIHGLGLIAREYIAAGAVTWRFEPTLDRVIAERDVLKLPPWARERVAHYAFFVPESRVFVLSGDDDRFTNHSDDPNTRERGEVQVAVRDIQVGEEITASYHEFIMLGFQPGRKK